MIVISFLVPAAIQTVLIVLLARRKLYRQFPFFLAYTLYSVLVTVPRLILVHEPSKYPAFYWNTEVIYGVLALLSLNEVFGRIFVFEYKEGRWPRLIFPISVLAIGMCIFAWWRFAYTVSHHHLGSLKALRLALHQGVHSIEGILFVIFVVMWVAYDPSWNDYDCNVLLGFGISGLITMIIDMVRFQSGREYELWYRYIPGLGYVLVCLIWLYGFWRPYEPKRRSDDEMHHIIQTSDRSNRVIQAAFDWLRRR